MWAKACRKSPCESPRSACLEHLQSEVLQSRTLLLLESLPSKLQWRRGQSCSSHPVQLCNSVLSQVPVRKRPRVQGLDCGSSGQKPQDTTESAEA